MTEKEVAKTDKCIYDKKKDVCHVVHTAVANFHIISVKNLMQYMHKISIAPSHMYWIRFLTEIM